MARPLQPGKKAVDLAAPALRVSRIRRDPPPRPVRPVTAAELRERDARHIVIGIIALALALFVVLIGVNNIAGWSPSQYSVKL